MKTKICLRCGKEYKPASGRQKYCSKCRVVAWKEEAKEYRKSHRKEANKRSKQYYLDHKEKISEHYKQYYLIHKEEMNRQHNQWARDNSEKQKEIWRKHFNKRERNLGFILLNEWFLGSVGHHMNKEFVVYIPEWLHKSVWHNVWTGQGMADINFKVLEWLNI